jgi:predicted lipoprotein
VVLAFKKVRIPMKITTLMVASLLAASLSGCKFVKTDTGEAGGTPADPIAELVDTTFDAKLVPALDEKAVDLATLRDAIRGGLDAAGQAHGVRVGGAGGGWNFPVKGTGMVIDENRASRAAVAEIDIDGDGTADATLQLGPVIRGTALRDTTALYDFSTFRDQIEYARLGRALNDKAVTKLPAADASLKGKRVNFLGAVVIRSASEKPLVMPVSIAVTP